MKVKEWWKAFSRQLTRRCIDDEIGDLHERIAACSYRIEVLAEERALLLRELKGLYRQQSLERPSAEEALEALEREV